MVEYYIDGDLIVFGFFYFFEFLFIYYLGIVFKIYEGFKNFYFCVEIKVFFVKVLQGYNVFGIIDLVLCFEVLLFNFVNFLFCLYDLLDVNVIIISRIDVIFLVCVLNENIVKQVIDYL